MIKDRFLFWLVNDRRYNIDKVRKYNKRGKCNEEKTVKMEQYKDIQYT